MSRLRSLLALCTVALSAAGCASSPSGTGAALGPPIPVRGPYLEMSTATSGVLVWPSGSAWVLLSTQDGFAEVTNRTPIGVETGGGLTVAGTPQRRAVAVGAHDRLVRSPLLSSAADWRWTTDELPDAVSGSRGAVAVDSGAVTAVVAANGGTLERRTAQGWSSVTSASALPGGDGVTLDSITWAGRTGWLTGHGSTHGANAFTTVDGGAHWSPVPGTSGRTVAALAPCGAGTDWMLPVVDGDDTMRVLRSTDSGARWTAGATVHTASVGPAYGCTGNDVWVAGAGNRLLVSADGGVRWVDRAAAPAALTDLAPTGDGNGFATSGGTTPVLWRVSDEGARFSRIELPAWVDALGETTGSD
jgi:hypothetical protein